MYWALTDQGRDGKEGGCPRHLFTGPPSTAAMRSAGTQAWEPGCRPRGRGSHFLIRPGVGVRDSLLSCGGKELKQDLEWLEPFKGLEESWLWPWCTGPALG